MVSSDKYIRYDDPSVEPSIPNEDALQQEIQSLISRVQSHNFSLHRHGFRGTHVKTQAVVKGQFTVSPNLPSHLAQGICSPENATRPHDIAIRFANELSFLQDDRAPGPRGCGLRIFDVAGSHLDPVGDRTRTQDLTFNNAPVLELRDLPTTVEIFRIRERHFRDPEKIAPEVKRTRQHDAELQMAPAQLPNRHFLSYTMYSQSAFRWGDLVAKYALFPSTRRQQSLADDNVISDTSDPEQHSLWLRSYFADHDAEYDLKVQLCRDIHDQSVEDTGVEWDKDRCPFETVGKIVLPKGQGDLLMAGERRTFWEDWMKLNVWYGLEAHRPLGSVNRLRRELYKISQANRERINGTGAGLVDVGSVDQIP